MSTQTNINKVFWKRKLYPINLVLFLIFPHQNCNSIRPSTHFLIILKLRNDVGFLLCRNLQYGRRSTRNEHQTLHGHSLIICNIEGGILSTLCWSSGVKRRKMLQDLKVGLWNYEGLKLIQGSRKIMMIVIVISKLSINDSLCGRI